MTVGLYNEFQQNDTSGYTKQNVMDALMKAVGITNGDASQFANQLGAYTGTYSYSPLTGRSPYEQLASDVLQNLGGGLKFGNNAKSQIASMLSSVEGLNTLAKYGGQESFDPKANGVLRTSEDKLGSYGDYVSSMLQNGGNSLAAFERDAGRVNSANGSSNIMDLMRKIGNDYGQASAANNQSLTDDLAGTDNALRYLVGQRFGGAASQVLQNALSTAGRASQEDTKPGPGAIVNRFWEQLPSRLEETGFEGAWANADPNRWRPYRPGVISNAGGAVGTGF